MNGMDEGSLRSQASGEVDGLRGDAPDGYWCPVPHIAGVVLCEHCRPLLTQSAEDQLAAIRGALSEYGEESMPSHVSTLQAARWLIDEHREQVRHNDELGAEHTAVVNERDTLAWLHAEAVWHYERAVEDWQGNDERVLAENQRLADENELLREELDKVSGGWEARVASRTTLRAERDALRAHLADALEGMEDMVGYVGDYFREKWGHDEYIARAKAALGTQAAPSPEASSEASTEEAQP